MPRNSHTIRLDDKTWKIINRGAAAARRKIGQQAEYLIELGDSIDPANADAENLPKAS